MGVDCYIDPHIHQYLKFSKKKIKKNLDMSIICCTFVKRNNMKKEVFYITLPKDWNTNDVFTQKIKVLTVPYKTKKGWEYLIEYLENNG